MNNFLKFNQKSYEKSRKSKIFNDKMTSSAENVQIDQIPTNFFQIPSNFKQILINCDEFIKIELLFILCSSLTNGPFHAREHLTNYRRKLVSNHNFPLFPLPTPCQLFPSKLHSKFSKLRRKIEKLRNYTAL